MTLELKYKEKFNEGKLDTLISLVRDGLIELKEAVKRSGLSENEFKQLLNSSQNDKVNFFY